MKTDYKVPEKLSEWIRVGVKCAKTVVRHKDYVLDLDIYHHIEEDNKCHVGFAGSVMAFGLNADIGSNIIPYRTNIEYQLYALNCIRRGDIWGGIEQFSNDKTARKISHKIKTNFEYDGILNAKERIKFYADMKSVAAQLQKLGY